MQALRDEMKLRDETRELDKARAAIETAEFGSRADKLSDEQALVRIDLIYRGALAQGQLQPDPTLIADQQAFQTALAAIRAAIGSEATTTALPAAGQATAVQAAPTQTQATVGTFTVQFASPDARAVDAALLAVRSVPGVQGAGTTSIAIGGTSVMRVNASASLDAIAAALRARGWQVTVGSNALSIRR